jgi:hypothetical protein
MLVEFVCVGGEIAEQSDVLLILAVREVGAIGLGSPVDDQRGKIGEGGHIENGLHPLINGCRERRMGAEARVAVATPLASMPVGMAML